MIKNKLYVPDGFVAVCVQLSSDHIISSAQNACKLNLDKDCIAIMHSKNHKPMIIGGNMAVSKSVIGKEVSVISTAEMELHPLMNMRIVHPSTHTLYSICFALDIQFHIKDPFQFLERCPYVNKLNGELHSLTDLAKEALEMTFIPIFQSIMGTYSLRKMGCFLNMTLFKATCDALNPLGIFVDHVMICNDMQLLHHRLTSCPPQMRVGCSSSL